MAQLQDRKNALSDQLHRARAGIQLHANGARANVDLGAKVRASFSKHRLGWIGAAALLGLILVRKPFRRKKGVVKATADSVQKTTLAAGIGLGAAKILFDLSKPMLIGWATRRLSQMANRNEKRSSKIP